MEITNNEALNDMFQLAVKDGYRHGKEDFKDLISQNPDALNDVYGLATNNGYNGDLNQFGALMGLEGLPQKKNQYRTSLDGGLFPEDDLTYKPNIQDDPVTPLGETFRGWWETIKEKGGVFTAAVDLLKEEQKLQAGDDPNFPDISPEQVEANVTADQKLQERIDNNAALNQANLEKLAQTPEYIETLKSLNTNIFSDNNPRESVEILRSLIGEYGFNVSFDARDSTNWVSSSPIVVTAVNGKGEVFLNTGDDADNIDQLVQLQKLFTENARAPKLVDPNVPLLEKAIQVKNMRQVPRLEKDRSGNVTASTVKLATFEMDGKHYVAPTLFPREGTHSTRPDAWLELDPKRDQKLIIELATRYGELIPFNTKEEADSFAKGSWKTMDTADVERRNFFINEGVVDYDSRKEIVENYHTLRDEYQLILGGTADGGFWAKQKAWDKDRKATPEEIAKYPNLFNEEGYLRSDAKEYAQSLKPQIDVLFEKAFGDEVYRDIQQQWDVIADKNREKFINNSTQANAQVDFALDEIDKFSLTNFETPFSEISSYTPKNENEALAISALTELQRRAYDLRETAALNFIVGKSYLDSKINKELYGEVVNKVWNNVVNEYNTRYPRGQAAEVILELADTTSFSAIGWDDRDATNAEDRRVASELISKYMKASVLASEGTSATALDFRRAKGWRESLEVFTDNPMEMALSVASGSLSEMLPYGAKMVPATALTTSLAYGAYALAAGQAGPQAATPEELLTVPASMFTGAVTGAQLGMAGSILGMEYTNAIFESMEEKGYDIFNPKSVEAALSDKNVWDDGQSKGLARGIPIAIIDFLSARLAGKIFYSTRGMNPLLRTGAILTERALIDPAAEGLGEALAQINNHILNGTELNGGEVALEAIGGFGANTSNMVANLLAQGLINRSKKVASDFADYKWNVIFDDTPLLPPGTTNWANNMRELNYIDADTEQRIQRRVGAQNEALEILMTKADDVTPENSDSVARLTHLLAAKNVLTTNDATQQAFKPVIKQINDEISEIALNGKWEPSMTQVSPSLMQRILDTTADAFAQLPPSKVSATIVEDEDYEKALADYKQSDLGGGMEGDSSEKNKLVETVKKLPAKQKEKLKEEFLKNNPDTEIDENGDIVVYRVGSIREGATPMTTSKKMAEILSKERADQGLSSNITKTKVKPKDVAVWVPGIESEVIVDVTPENIESIEKSSEEISEGKSLKELKEELAEAEKALENTNKAIEEGTEDMLEVIIDNKPKLERRIKNLKAAIKKKIKDAAKKVKPQTKQKQQEAIDEDAGMEIEDLENEITNVKQELAKDLKKPGLSKEEKSDLRQEARELIREYKAEIAEIKREARKAVKARTPKPKKAEDKATTYSAEEAKLAKDLEDGTFFKLARNQYAIDKLAEDYGMNDEGYMNNVDNPSRLISEGEKLGITVRKSRGPGYIFTRDGSFYNPTAHPDFGKRAKTRPQMSAKDQAELLKLLSLAFPTYKVVVDQAKFDAEIKKPEVQRRIVRGYTVYGMNRNNNTIFINPNDKSFEIAIHEFSHPWLDYLASPASGTQGTALLRQGIKVVKTDSRGKPYYDEAKRIYGDKKTKQGYELAAIEALSDYIADEGGRFARYVESDFSKSKKAKENPFIRWIKKFWAYIKNWLSGTFKKNKKGERESTMPEGEALEQMSLERFANMALGDLLGGQEVNPDFVPEESPQLSLFSQKEETLSFDSDVNLIIQRARERGIPDASIKKVLKDRIKFTDVNYTAADVDAAMKFTLDETKALPEAFANMEGGFFAGMSLFQDVNRAVNEFIGERGILEDVRNEYAAELRRKYPDLKTQNTSTILRRYPLPIKKGEVLRKKSEVRKFAKEYLQGSVLFKQQPKNIQQELVVALDKNLNIRTGKEVTAEIKELKKLITERKRAVRDINRVKNELVRFIRLNFPDETDTTKSILRSLTKVVADIETPDDYMAAVERVLQAIDKQNEKTKRALINSIYKILNIGGRPAKTISSQVRSRGVDAETGLFMQQARRVLKMVINKDAEGMKSLREELGERENEIQAALEADRKGELLSLEQNRLLALTAAYDMFGDIESLSLEEVREILDDVKAEREIGRAVFAENRMQRFNEINEISEKFTGEIKDKLAPFLFNENGTLKNEDRIAEDFLNIWKGIKEKGLQKSLQQVKDEILKPLIQKGIEPITATFRSLLGITYTLMNALDNGQSDVFVKDIYYRLADAEENYNLGYFRFMDKIEEIAAEIMGAKEFDSEVILPFRDKKMFKGQLGKISAYEFIKQEAILKDRLNIPGVNIQQIASTLEKAGIKLFDKTNTILKDWATDNSLTVPQLMYIYSQWKHPDAKEMLIQDGFTQEKIDMITDYLGENLVRFVDEVLEMLTYQEFDLTNAVYVEENQQNLKQEFPYFPRKTEKRIKSKESERSSFSDTGFVKNFQNISPSLISERVQNTKALRVMFADFFSVLEKHAEDNERYKAYAKVVKILDGIVNTPAVRTYLDIMFIRAAVTKAINDAIHPKGYLTKSKNFNDVNSWLMERMVSWALALKPVQLPKQASSYINGFVLYNNPKFAVFETKKKGDPIFRSTTDLKIIAEDIAENLKSILGGTVNETREFLKFTQAYMKLMRNKKDTIRRATELSAQFRARRKEGLEGKMYALTTGQERVDLGPEYKKLAQSFKLVNQAFGYFTTQGDIWGVLGYMVAYDNMIENGVDPKEALRYFNDYNLTQQTRRGLDKNSLQTSQNKVVRGFTMFGSSLFLALNRVFVHEANIRRALLGNKVADKRDVRGLLINLFFVQLVFSLVGNLPLLLGGDKKDREKAFDRILSSPMNVVKIVPFLGNAFQTFLNESNAEGWKNKWNRAITNPLDDLAEELGRDISSGDILEIPSTILQFVAGAQFRTPRGLARIFLGQGNFWYNFWSMLGYGDGSIPRRWLPPKDARDDLFIN